MSGNVPAIVLGTPVVVAVVAVPGSVNAVVVSAFVAVIVEVVAVGCSPGAPTVDAAPLA